MALAGSHRRSGFSPCPEGSVIYLVIILPIHPLSCQTMLAHKDRLETEWRGMGVPPMGPCCDVVS